MPWWGVLAIVVTQAVGNIWLFRFLAETWRDRSMEQLKADLVKLQATLAGGIEHKVWVSRVQFETEFNAIREIWAALAEVRRDLAGARPIVDRIGDIDYEDLIKQRGNVLGASLRHLTVTSDGVEPFISTAVYDATIEARKIAMKEMADLQGAIDGHDRDSDWWTRAMQHPQEFNAAMSQIASAVRERLGSLQILPTS